MNTTIETSLLSVSILELSKEDLQREFINLKKAWTIDKTDLESKRQEIYDLKRELSRAVALEKDCMHDLEVLQFGHNVVVKKNHALEDEVTSLKENRRVAVLALQEELNVKDTEIERLETELKSTSKENVLFSNSEEYDKLADNIFNLKLEFDLCLKNNEELKTDLECLQKQNIKLEENIVNIQTEYDSMKEIYNYKKEELIESTALVDTLQEELLITKNELDMIRTKPIDPLSRGNSLFAEVNDRRLQLQGNMKTMKSQYELMRRERSTMLHQITALQNENTKLSKRWEDDVKYKETCGDRFLESNQERLKYLELIVKKYEEVKSERLSINGVQFKPEHFKFLETRMNNKDAEIDRLLKEVNKLSMSETVLTEEICETNLMLREWKSKATRLECEIAQLKTEIELFKLNKPQAYVSKCAVCEKNQSERYGVPKAGLKLLEKSKFKIKKEIIADEPNEISRIDLSSSINNELSKLDEKENKIENANKITNRKVNFADDTVESKVTDRKMYRPRGKLLTYCPPVKVPPTIIKKEV